MTIASAEFAIDWARDVMEETIESTELREDDESVMKEASETTVEAEEAIIVAEIEAEEISLLLK